MKVVSRSGFGVLALLSLLITTALLTALVPSTETKLLPIDSTFFQQFGSAVGIDGDTAVVGAPNDGQAGADAGAAYVFVHDGSSWVEQGKLVASDAARSAQFGNAVALSGDTLVVGAHSDGANGVSAGAAYVFVRSGTTWIQQARLVASDPGSNEQFGCAVAIEGDTVAVGALGDGTVFAGTGAVYVFERSGGAWTQQAKLVSNNPRPGNALGLSVGLSGDTIVAGSPYDEDTGVVDAGAVYVFSRTAGSWSQQAELRAGDAGPNDHLGWSVSVSGDTLMAGAPDQDGLGAAYVFTRAGGVWSSQAKLTADDGVSGDSFGVSVSLAGSDAVVGADFGSLSVANGGTAYLFQRSGTTWSQEAEICGEDIAEWAGFGSSVALSGTTVVVGAPFNGDLFEGAAFVFGSEGNTAPVANPQSLTTDEDTLATLTLTGSDAEGDALTFAVLTAPTRGTLSGTAPNLTYTPNLNENGSDSFTFRVNDGALDSAVATVSITITAINDAPVANSQTVTTSEDTAAGIPLTGSDVENDALTFTVMTAPTKGTLNGTAPNLTYTPNANANGSDSFSFKVNDGALDSAVAAVSIAIAPVNDSPSIRDIGDQTAVENSATGPIAFVVTDIDTDVTTLIVSAVSDNAILVPATAFAFIGSGADRTLIVTPAASQSGTANITVTVSDGAAGVSDTFALTVTALNHPPVADASASPARVISPNNLNARVALDGSRSSDPDADMLTYTWFADGNMATPIGTGITGSVTFNVGTHRVALVVNDGRVTDADDVTVRVIKLSQAINEIIAFVEGSNLSRNLKKEIIHNLTDAARDCDRGKFRQALEGLRSLKRKIESLARRKIDPAMAEALTAQIQVVIDVLNGR
ncbi:MAG TPA: Ig-like domain-containing protein [Verrucomicrobiae bacterium]|nr:Ig-like domain-containing protein [Verrucomicrobiae bacterium]